MNDRPRYTLTLQAEGAGPPGAIRLRRLLKVALRAFGLRCVDVRQAPTDTADANVGPPTAILREDHHA